MMITNNIDHNINYLGKRIAIDLNKIVCWVERDDRSCEARLMDG